MACRLFAPTIYQSHKRFIVNWTIRKTRLLILITIRVISSRKSRWKCRLLNDRHSSLPQRANTLVILQRLVERRNYVNKSVYRDKRIHYDTVGKFVSYTSWFDIFVYFPFHFGTLIFQHGTLLVLLIFRFQHTRDLSNISRYFPTSDIVDALNAIITWLRWMSQWWFLPCIETMHWLAQ